MKKLLAIVVLGLLWCNVLFASELQRLLNDGYELKTTNLSDDGRHLIYNLTRTRSGIDTVKTCILSFTYGSNRIKDTKLESCFSP